MQDPTAEPVIRAWNKGDYALHEADAKDLDCVMIVMSRAKDWDGQPALSLRYAFPDRLPQHWGGKSGRRRVIAKPQKLFSPADFGISVSGVMS